MWQRKQTSRKSRKPRESQRCWTQRGTHQGASSFSSKIKDKDRILKAARGVKRVTYKGFPIRLSADFSKETLQPRRGWKEIFQVMKGKNLHPRLVYPAKLSLRIGGQIKCFPDMVKLKEFIISQPLLYEMLKGLIQEKKMIKNTKSKMTTHNYQQLNLNKQTKQANNQNRNRITEMEITWRVISRERERGEWWKRQRE